MEDAELLRRITRFIQLKLVSNVGLTLVAVLGYLSQPDGALLIAFLVLLADTAFIWPYWLLARRGHGRPATYVTLGLSAVNMAVGVHLAGGFGTALSAMYALLVLAGGLVTGSEVGPVVVAGLCTLAYLFVAGIEYLGIVPSYVEMSLAPSIALAAVTGILVSIWGTALISRVFLRTVKAATKGLRRIAATERERTTENARLLAEREETLAQQSRLIETVQKLFVPIVPLMEGVVAFPLVGYIDRERANRILDNLLNEVARQRPRVVLLDVTGLAGVDQVTVDCLDCIVQGVRLLGAKVVLVGIQAALAETMAGLGLDATRVTVQRDMQSGIAHVLAQTRRMEAGGW